MDKLNELFRKSLNKYGFLENMTDKTTLTSSLRRNWDRGKLTDEQKLAIKNGLIKLRDEVDIVIKTL